MFKIYALIIAILCFAFSMSPSATTLFNSAHGADGEAMYVGIEALLTPQFDPAFVAGPFPLQPPSQWVERISVSYLCWNCSSAVLVVPIADGKPMFTPLILRGAPRTCVPGQETSGDGRCYEPIQGVVEFTIKRWIYNVEVRIGSAGYGTFEMQISGMNR